MIVRDFHVYLAIATRPETEALFGLYPNILNSYWYFKGNIPFIQDVIANTEKFILDSGAFSAFTCGKQIYLDQYLEYVNSIERKDAFEYITLDVIGDGAKTYALLEKTWEAGHTPVPVFHAGSNMGQLVAMCDMGIERLCLGGLVGKDNKHFLDEAWRIILKHQRTPIRVHGLGLTNFRDMIRYPWFSVDSSSVSGCYRFGRAFRYYDRHNKRFAGAMHVHDYMRLFFPQWEDQPIGPKPNEQLGGISPQVFLIREQAKLWLDAQAHLQELRLTSSFKHIGNQDQFFFMEAGEWSKPCIPDEQLPLIAPPSVRMGGSASIESRQADWDFSAYTIDKECECCTPGVVAIDFETFYTSDYSVSTMGAWAYTRDERFKPYCISAAGEGRLWCGPVELFDWSKLKGRKVLAHNVSFERDVVERLVQDGLAPKWTLDIDWIDTADLCAYFNFPRALDDAMFEVFGESLDKSVRERLESCNCTETEVLEYCGLDSISSHRLFDQLFPQWAPHEQEISKETQRIGRGNIYVDTEKAKSWLGEIQDYLQETIPSIPFDPPGSDAKASAFLESEFAVSPPPNWRVNTPEYMDWKIGLPKQAADWVTLREDFKKARKIYKTIEAVLSRTDDHERLFYELLYFGATTGRWSGAGGLNMQNWHRKARWNIRNLLIAPAGYVLGMHDFSQIEARSLLWLAEDWKQLQLIREIGDVYEAHARATMGYADPRKLKDANPDMRHLAKARVLALGYGCGAQNFQFMAQTLAGITLTQAVCKETVDDYRTTNSGIVDLWKQRESAAAACVGGTWVNALPSGRKLYYRDLKHITVEKTYDGQKRKEKQLFARTGRRMVGVYGGLLIENENQAFCRDIMAAAWLRTLRAGYKPAMTIHDELVYLYPEKTAERDKVVVDAVMSEVPSWCAGLPLEVEGKLSPFYTK